MRRPGIGPGGPDRATSLTTRAAARSRGARHGNAGPKRETLDPLYRLTRDGGAGGGLFDEADQTDPRRESFVEEEVTCAAQACRSGEPTTENGSKLDLVFFSHNRVGGALNADALQRGGSGHRLYRASAELKL